MPQADERTGFRVYAPKAHRDEWTGIPATGKQILLTGINIYTIADSKLSESNVNWDMLGLMQQLGAVSMRLQVPDRTGS